MSQRHGDQVPVTRTSASGAAPAGGGVAGERRARGLCPRNPKTWESGLCVRCQKRRWLGGRVAGGGAGPTAGRARPSLVATGGPEREGPLKAVRPGTPGLSPLRWVGLWGRSLPHWDWRGWLVLSLEGAEKERGASWPSSQGSAVPNVQGAVGKEGPRPHGRLAFSLWPPPPPFRRDLKRDVAKKLEKLEKRTQRAIAELIRKSGPGRAAPGPLGGGPSTGPISNPPVCCPCR